MTIEEAENAYNAVSEPLLAAFQAGEISFQEFHTRHNENCSIWRTNLTLALENDGEPFERNQAVTKAVFHHNSWVDGGEFDPDTFTKALENNGYSLVRNLHQRDLPTTHAAALLDTHNKHAAPNKKPAIAAPPTISKTIK